MPHQPLLHVTTLLLFTWAANVSPACAQVESPAPTIAIDARSKDILDSIRTYYAGVRGLRFHANEVLETLKEHKVTRRSDCISRISVERPNRIAYVNGPGENEASSLVVCDGSSLFVYTRTNERYAAVEAPRNWKQVLQFKAVQVAVAANPALNAILNPDPASRLLDAVQTVKYVALVDLKGDECHLLNAVGRHSDWQLWIRTGTRPLIMRFAMERGKHLPTMSKDDNRSTGPTWRTITTFSDWVENPGFANHEFMFKAPDGANEQASLRDLLDPRHRQTAPTIALKAKRILDAFDDYLTGLKGFSVASTHQKTTNGIADTVAIIATVCVQRPDRLVYRRSETNRPAVLASDGHRMAVQTKLLDSTRHDTSDAPMGLTLVPRNRAFDAAVGGRECQNILLQMLLSDDITVKMFGYSRPDSLNYIGDVDYRDRRCHLLQTASQMSTSTLQYWFDATGVPLLRGFAVTTPPRKDKHDQATVCEEVWLDHWDVSPQFSDDAFDPNAATQVWIDQ